MSDTPVALGPFLLGAPIARGGQGAVHRGVHVETGLDVAVKILAWDPVTRSPAWLDRFRDEIRAVAALDHPGIATVLDHGQAVGVPMVVDGAPWYAMPYAPGGTLARWPRRSFVDLKLAWLRILDALAHAHARGVVHRDLKPSNVLLLGDPADRPGLSLVDFGVSFARFDPDTTGPIDDQVVGTPAYMAPEQVRGEWRDLGPWTDLYALGCLAWAMATGTTPFASRTAADTLVGHVSRPPPRFVPEVAVPAELEGWLRALLEKEPDRRFQRAADAAYALAQIGEAVGEGAAGVLAEGADTQLAETPMAWPRAARRTGTRPPPAPVPPTWRRAEPTPPPLPRVGAGLRLFGLRRVRVVGRLAERDRLWEALRAVAATGRARLVVVRGPAGTGKTALVQWLTELADETGAATWAKASFTPALTQGEPLRRMGVNWLRCKGLTRAEVRARIDRFFEEHGGHDPDQAAILTELIHPASDAERRDPAQSPVRLTRFREFYAGSRNGMVRQSLERPLIAWFEDVQWGIHGIGLATQILRTQDQQPSATLVVLTVRDEALVPGSIEADRLARLLATTPDAVEIRLPPLPREAQAELVSGMLGLAPPLAARIVDRTAGNPLFAVQLVGALVNRGVLVLGPRGLDLAPGASAELPADVTAVWRSHLERVLREFPEQAEVQLEIAAVLGTPVDRREWRRACDDPEGLFGERFPGDEALRRVLVERLIDERLAMRTPQGWAFVHGMLEEALIASAATHGRLRAHHEAAAAALRPRASDPAVAERLGLHLLGADRPGDAVDPLLRGVEVRWASTGPTSALALIGRLEAASRALPADDPRHARRHELTGGLYLEQGDLDAARAAVASALDGRRAHGWPVGRAREVSAALALRRGAFDEAQAIWRDMASDADPETRARGEKGLGQWGRRTGDLARAAAHFATAVDGFAAIGDLTEAAACDALRGKVHLQLGELGEARAALDRARTACEALGAVAGLGDTLDALARVQRAAGEPGAEATLRAAISLFEALGAAGPASIARLRLAAWAAQAHPSRDPRAEVAAVLDAAGRLPDLDASAREVVQHAVRWVAAALRSDLPGWDAGYEAIKAGLVRLAAARQGVAAETVAWLGWIAGALLPADQTVRRDRAVDGVIGVFTALGRPDRIDEVERAFGRRG